MHANRLAVSTVVLALAGLLFGGCSAALSTPGTSAAAQSPSLGPVQTNVPTASPTASVQVASASPLDSPPGGSPESEPTLVPPPDASLAVEGGDPVVGEQGSWSWNGAASDAPWLPGFPLHIGANERLTFKMSGGVSVATWQVARVLPSAVPGGDGAGGMAEGTGSAITFAAPPEGRWSVAVTVQFADVLGDAVYYWAVTVD